MGLALCHGVPRDNLVLLALLFFVVAFVLEVIVIGSHNSNTAAGYFTDAKGPNPKARIGFIGCHTATYGKPASVYVQNCNPNAAMLRYHCSRFSEAFHLLNGLVLASFICCVVFVVASLFVVVRLSRTTASVLFKIHFLAGLPTALQCAVVGVFFARVVPHAREDFLVSLYASNPASAKLVFHRLYASNLMIAATALVCFGYLIIAVKHLAILCARRSLKRKRIRQSDVESLMKMHLVNDDWERQKQILRSHAKSVQVEMEMQKESSRVAAGGDAGFHEGRRSRSLSSSSSSSSSSRASSLASAGADEPRTAPGSRRSPGKRGTGNAEDGFRFKIAAGNSFNNSRKAGGGEAESAFTFSEVEVKTPRHNKESHEPVNDRSGQ